MPPRTTSRPERKIQDAIVDSLISSNHALQAAVDALKDTTATLHTAVFGRWDSEQNRQIPGLQANTEALRVGQEQLGERVRSLFNFVKWGSIITAAPLIVVTLRAIGVPTESIWRLISAGFTLSR